MVLIDDKYTSQMDKQMLNVGRGQNNIGREITVLLVVDVSEYVHHIIVRIDNCEDQKQSANVKFREDSWLNGHRSAVDALMQNTKGRNVLLPEPDPLLWQLCHGVECTAKNN